MRRGLALFMLLFLLVGGSYSVLWFADRYLSKPNDILVSLAGIAAIFVFAFIGWFAAKWIAGRQW